jgi:hypothetical protein
MHCARLILISSFLLSFANFALSQTNDLTHRPQLARSYGDTPLAFELNQGQAPAEIQFLSHSTGSSVELGTDRAVFTLSQKDMGNPHSDG